MYGTELMADNVRECKRNILMTLLRFSADKDWDLKDKKIVNIIIIIVYVFLFLLCKKKIVILL